jgi:hypothetical protein
MMFCLHSLGGKNKRFFWVLWPMLDGSHFYMRIFFFKSVRRFSGLMILTKFWCVNFQKQFSQILAFCFIYIYSLNPCLMHRCVCIWQYILQNYKHKLHFQNLSIYHIPHVSIRTLAAENLDVCAACDPWDSLYTTFCMYPSGRGHLDVCTACDPWDSLYTTFCMYPSGPWPLKILMFAVLVTHEIATYSWPW